MKVVMFQTNCLWTNRFDFSWVQIIQWNR